MLRRCISRTVWLAVRWSLKAQSIENSELIVRQLYVASINARSGLANWQAYRVLADSVGVASLLPRVWFEDSLVSRGAAQLEVIDSAKLIEQDVPIDAKNAAIS